MTLSHNCNTAWVDANNMASEHDGLTDFGVKVVHEMNRLGMLVDLSHISAKAMSDVLDATKAPVIYSHSSSYTICPHNRNVVRAAFLGVKKANLIWNRPCKAR